jgi:RNA-directed DNA polymerase
VIQSLNHFEAVLGCSRKDIRWVINNQDLLRYSYHVEKSNNRQREISPSLGDLKDIQNRLNDRVFSNVIFPYYVVGSTKKRSGVLNAKLHSGLLYHFKTDLSSFFDFVTFKEVNTALLGLGFSSQIAELITKLVTYKGHVPQGASTSSFIANLVGLRFDHEILKVCQEMGVTYTRYVDDLLFSADHCFQSDTSRFLEIVRKCGFRHNHKKTYYKLGDIEATGAITGCNGLRATDATLEKYNSAESMEVRSGCEGYMRYIERINGMSIAEYKKKYSELRFPEKIMLLPQKQNTS